MPNRNHTSDVLESTLQELCHQQGDARSFSTLYQEELKALQAESFPADLQSKYRRLMVQLDQAFEDPSCPDDQQEANDPAARFRDTLIADLLHLYANLQTHKTPYVNKTRFLDRLSDSAPAAAPEPFPSEGGLVS